MCVFDNDYNFDQLSAVAAFILVNIQRKGVKYNPVIAKKEYSKMENQTFFSVGGWYFSI